MDYNAQLREKLRAGCDRRGWSTNELAKRAGLTQSTVHGIITGRNGATYARAMLLLDVLRGRRTNPEEGA